MTSIFWFSLLPNKAIDSQVLQGGICDYRVKRYWMEDAVHDMGCDFVDADVSSQQ